MVEDRVEDCQNACLTASSLLAGSQLKRQCVRYQKDDGVET